VFRDWKSSLLRGDASVNPQNSGRTLHWIINDSGVFRSLAFPYKRRHIYDVIKCAKPGYRKAVTPACEQL
jgi:hypothetical protein